MPQVAIIGLGLIGGSILQGLYERKFASRLVACDKSSMVKLAKEQGLVNLATTDIATAIAGVDMIVIATPTKAIEGVLREIFAAIVAGVVKYSVIITDVASTKGNILTYAEAIFGTVPAHFVPAHPIAGAEKSGFSHRNAQLFVGHQVIVCPHAGIDKKALHRVKQLWQTLGAYISEMDAVRHDTILAHTSHLPHLLAYNLTYQLACHSDNLDIFRYAAGGFRDFSRIAASDPTMWHDIFLANKTAILVALDAYEAHLGALRQLINTENSQKLQERLTTAKDARTHFGYMLLNTRSQAEATTMQTYRITPTTQSITGTIRVASDKSISHRTIMLGSLADGVTRVRHFLNGDDALCTLQAFQAMGVKIEQDGDSLTIYGVGIDGLCAPVKPLDMGNSGTSMRLLAGILAAQSFDSVLVGDVSLSKRPMERVAEPLRLMGADIQSTGAKGTAPLAIKGGQTLHGIDYRLPVASAQIKSCLLLAGLFAQGQTTIDEPKVSRDHSERMLQAFGYTVDKVGERISIVGGGRLTACDIVVPADISSAAFFMVLASIAKDGKLTLSDVGINPTRTGVIDILSLMGADITLHNTRQLGGEPVADITVRPATLHGIDIPEHLVPLAIDEFPVLFIAASCAIGQTRLTGAKELRVKESDRISVMAEGLAVLGVTCRVLDDGIIITGKGDSNAPIFTGGTIDAQHDHRIAMSFSVAAARASDEIVITGTETVNSSFPDFARLACQVGLPLTVCHAP